MPVTKGIGGRFIQTTPVWSLENFDAGYVINKGRFMVRMPSHPRAYKNGYILRAIVAYEAYHGVSVKKGERIHHINGNKLDDSKENLQLVTQKEHAEIHARLSGSRIKRVCETCGKEFEIQKGRLKDKSNGTKQRGRFCSQECFHAFPKPDDFHENHSKIMKKVWIERDEETKKEISRKLKQTWKRKRREKKLAS